MRVEDLEKMFKTKAIPLEDFEKAFEEATRRAGKLGMSKEQVMQLLEALGEMEKEKWKEEEGGK